MYTESFSPRTHNSYTEEAKALQRSVAAGTRHIGRLLHPRHQADDVMQHVGVWLSLPGIAVVLSFFVGSPRLRVWRVTRVCPGAYRRRRCLLVRVRPIRPAQRAKRPAMTEARRTCPEPHPSRKALGIHFRFRHPLRCAATLYFLLCVHLTPRAVAVPTAPVLTSRVAGEKQAVPSVVRAFGMQAVTPSASSKRSFKRAQRRAIRDGIARYRGRLHTPDSLALQYVGQAAPRRPPSQPRHQQGALRCVSWNAGGLHAGRYQELLGWLDSHTTDPIHIVCIQETHWADWAEYNKSSWMCIHSGTGSSQAGILFLIRKTFVIRGMSSMLS